ncbi:hypothetical protein GLIP_3576 [Aliiglaciecola lipolytica E3]|uniref:histidine kinase n=1 Tax=Aliiglaciecola lipolytica E3 TaxID=1127673 RepID=K6YDB0_9ALTE|nr:hypothetical protein GLIP_3576 [Aliiglaciecola lipolytica E3]
MGLVYSVLQGKDAIWIGGENGLFKVTGLHIDNISTNKSPFDSFDVEGLAEDSKGNIWVTMFGNGVVIYDQYLNSYKHLNIENGLTSQYCLDIEIFKNKAYLNCEKVISIIDTETFEVLNFAPTDTFNFKFIESIQITSTGDFYFKDSEQILYNIKDTKLSRPQIYFDSNHELKVDNFHSDLKGVLWISIGRTLYKVVDSKLIEILTAKSKIKKIFSYSEDSVIFVSDSFYLIESGYESSAPILQILNVEGLKIEDVYDVDITHSGGVIFAAPLIGVGYFNELTSTIKKLLPSNLKNINIQASAELEPDKIALAFGDNLYLYDRTERILQEILTSVGVVTAMVFDTYKSRLLVGVEDKGLLEVLDINNKPKTKYLFSDQGIIVDIVGNSNNTVNFGILSNNKPGIYEIDEVGNSTLIFSNENIDNIYRKSDGKLFAATRHDGVFNVQDYIQINNKPNGYIKNCLVEDKQGTIWLCTDGGGLAFVDDASGELQFIDTKYTANSRHIRELVQDSEDYFWVMTNQGLVRYDHANKTSIKLGREDGIKDIDFEITASINLSDEQILVAGDRNNYVINTIEANQFLNKRLKKVNKAVFVDLSVLLREKQGMVSKKLDLIKSINSDSPLEFSYEEFLFELTFAASNFIDRDVLKFQYRLVGLNDSWVEASAKNASATYSTLPSGDYLFEVRVVDPKSASIQPTNSIKIRILPPYWQTWQAYTMYAVSAILALFSFIKFRMIQLKILSKRLESSVLKHTREIATSKSRLGDMLRHKEFLYANASHEFRTPLSLISGPIEQLRRLITDSEAIKLLELVQGNAFRLTNLVDQILELSKIDSRKLDYKVLYDLHASIEVIVESFRPITLVKNQNLTLDNTCSGVGEYVADSLEKILSNLIMNAFNYNSIEGEVKVTSSCEDKFLKIEVVDQGKGIEQDNIDLIFKRFTRLENATDNVGSGLGLAVVEELVIANGGKIEVESKLQIGTKFTVFMPLVDNPKIKQSELFVSFPMENNYFAPDLSEKQEITPKINQDTNRKPSVLIVEDQVDMRKYLTLIFSNDYKCYSAKNGQEGFDKSLEVMPDIIITDLMMPVFDGFQLTTKIRENELTSHIPIIILTAKGDDETRMDGWNHNVDDYINKPFDIDELLLRAKNLLDIRRKISRKYNFNTVENKNVFELNNDGKSSERDTRFYDKFITWLESNYKDDKTNRARAVSDLAISERQLNRKLNAFTNSSFNDLLRKYRLIKAKAELLKGKQITETAFNVGFASSSYFSNQFKKEFGLSPKAYVEKMKQSK